MFDKLAKIENEYAELERKLANPNEKEELKKQIKLCMIKKSMEIIDIFTNRYENGYIQQSYLDKVDHMINIIDRYTNSL